MDVFIGHMMTPIFKLVCWNDGQVICVSMTHLFNLIALALVYTCAKSFDFFPAKCLF